MSDDVRDAIAEVLVDVLYGDTKPPTDVERLAAGAIQAKLAEGAYQRAVRAWLVDNEPGTPDAWHQRDLRIAIAATLGIDPNEVRK